MTLQETFEQELKDRGAGFIHFVDLSGLLPSLSKGYTCAVLIGIKLSALYIKRVSSNVDYVVEMVKNKEIEQDEFHLKELQTDRLADFAADYLTKLGYSSFSQSEDNLERSGSYDLENQMTPLPHKTIGLMAGLGWIGKNDLLVTPQFGCGISMCTVLTNAPFESDAYLPAESECGSCTECLSACTLGAIKGHTWHPGARREDLIAIEGCKSCLQCMVQCPWTLKYMKRELNEV